MSWSIEKAPELMSSASKAAAALAEIAPIVARGGAHPVPQAGKGRLYQRKDFSAKAVKRLHENFQDGMIAEYLAHKAARDAKLDLVALAVTS